MDSFKEFCDKFGVDFSEFESFLKTYKEILKSFNQTHNLTNFKDLDEQILDSVFVLNFYDFSAFKNIFDIGSGAGFPAVFLAFFLKNANFYLFEPNAKKAAFLRLIKIECKLNLNINKEKAQFYKSDLKADLITSRALMSVKNLLELCESLSDTHTKFLLYKGSNLKLELKELSQNYKSEIYEKNFRKYCFLSRE